MLGYTYFNGNNVPIKDEFNNPWTHLAAMIVAQAAADYARLGDRYSAMIDGSSATKGEIREFFQSEWCEFLTSWQDITPAEMLKKLEGHG